MIENLNKCQPSDHSRENSYHTLRSKASRGLTSVAIQGLHASRFPKTPQRPRGMTRSYVVRHYMQRCSAGATGLEQLAQDLVLPASLVAEPPVRVASLRNRCMFGLVLGGDPFNQQNNI